MLQGELKKILANDCFQKNETRKGFVTALPAHHQKKWKAQSITTRIYS